MHAKELSPKSHTILAAIAQGHSYDQILAGELDLSRECGVQGRASDYACFTLYRWTESVTCTGS